MDYVPVYADEMDAPKGGMGSKPSGDGPMVSIDPAVVQNMNVQTEPVARRAVSREIRTVGYLEYDQQKMVSVTTKYSGFVEKVYVNYLGEPVKRGQPLFDIYSPELVQTEQELLSAQQYAKRMEGATADARERAASLVAAARQRLAYWDITPAQVEHLMETGTVHRALTVTAPASGVVMMRKEGLEGMGVKPGMELFHIADLSSLWLSVEVFEDQLAWVREGSMADVTLSYFPGEHFTARVRYIEPEVSEKTRTVSLKLEVPNKGGKLKSGMYATVVFRPAAAENAVAIPSQAVLRTGERNVVIVALGKGQFVPRDVKLGASGEGWVQVLSGVEPGEQIVTSSQFLIDSESNLKAAVQKMVEKKRKEMAAKGGPDA
jgi:Cu(I)/Ag(I) efflux system membrane fusion protein/cobalt-zinc-cadmium efflux system membrane fusion protein